MPRKFSFFFAALGVLLCVAYTTANLSAYAGTVTITLRNAGAFDNTYELFDNVCNQALPAVPIPAHGTANVGLCTSPQGYASFKSRIKGNTTWNNHDLISAGQVVDP